MSTTKKIAWVTYDSFVDCDFNPEILACILEKYIIDWYVILPKSNAIYENFNFFELSKNLKNLHITIIKAQYENGDFRRFEMYVRIFKLLKNSKADIFYINCPPTPYLIPLIYLLDKSKTVFTAHQGEVHAGFNNPWKHKLVRYLIYSRVIYVNLFSNYQAKLFCKHFPNKKISIIPLALKTFGNPDNTLGKSKKVVEFLSFGHIYYGKNIELLIKAGCNLFEKGYTNFIIKIYGKCNNWEFYASKIKYPAIFDCKIELIDNKEIPNLFNSVHYLVQPYRIVTQSGPTKIAFNYNLPVICSNLPGFSDEVIEGKNGLLFESNNVDALEKKLIEAIDLCTNGEYEIFCDNMKTFNEKIYAPLILSKQYLAMFNGI